MCQTISDAVMESKESHKIVAALARRAKEGANSAHIADAVASTWLEIERALTPILGQQGVAALYKRSLHLTGSTYSWLVRARENVHPGIDLDALKIALSQQSGADAAAGGGAFLQTFYELLASLIGSSLTERLLRSVWAHCLTGPSAQDTSS